MSSSSASSSAAASAMLNFHNYLLVLAFIAVTAYIQFADCHVALTYPPARQYDLDFLDNSRTKGPCGMPKGKFVDENKNKNCAKPKFQAIPEHYNNRKNCPKNP